MMMKASGTPMIDRPINRRQFLALAGAALGASAIACRSLSIPGSANSDEPAEETPAVPFPDTTYGDPTMNKKILVTYATGGGATAGAAEAIAKKLAECGLTADVRPVTAVTDLSPYSAAVLGSAIHSGEWLPEMLEFMKKNQTALRSMPTAVFQVCMMLAADPVKNQKWADGWLEPIRSLVKPAAEKSFAGMLFPDRYTKFSEKLGLRIFLATIKMKPGDYRDWDAINAWAASLPAVLA